MNVSEIYRGETISVLWKNEFKKTIVDNQEQFLITRLVFSSLRKVVYYSAASTFS